MASELSDASPPVKLGSGTASDAKEAYDETEPASSSSSPPFMFLSQWLESVNLSTILPSRNESSTGSVDASGVAYAARSIMHVPSFFSSPPAVSSAIVNAADFGSKPPVFEFFFVQMSARSWLVRATRESEPSTLESDSTTSIAPVVVRRGPRFHTTTSFDCVSTPGSRIWMSCARK